MWTRFDMASDMVRLGRDLPMVTVDAMEIYLQEVTIDTEQVVISALRGHSYERRERLVQEVAVVR